VSTCIVIIISYLWRCQSAACFLGICLGLLQLVIKTVQLYHKQIDASRYTDTHAIITCIQTSLQTNSKQNMTCRHLFCCWPLFLLELSSQCPWRAAVTLVHNSVLPATNHTHSIKAKKLANYRIYSHISRHAYKSTLCFRNWNNDQNSRPMCKSTLNIKTMMASVLIIFKCTFTQHYGVIWSGVL